MELLKWAQKWFPTSWLIFELTCARQSWKISFTLIALCYVSDDVILIHHYFNACIDLFTLVEAPQLGNI